jgi:hypothetical protein
MLAALSLPPSAQLCMCQQPTSVWQPLRAADAVVVARIGSVEPADEAELLATLPAGFGNARVSGTNSGYPPQGKWIVARASVAHSYYDRSGALGEGATLRLVTKRFNSLSADCVRQLPEGSVQVLFLHRSANGVWVADHSFCNPFSRPWTRRSQIALEVSLAAKPEPDGR